MEQQPTQDIGINTDKDEEVEKLKTRICELEGEVRKSWKVSPSLAWSPLQVMM